MENKTRSFEDRILFMVRNFAEYGSYGGNLKKAVRLLNKYHPEKSAEECSLHFNNYLKVYNEVIEFVYTHREYYWKQYNNKEFFENNKLSEEELNFIRNRSCVPDKIIEAMMGWIFFWHHLK
jgi:hypothetical protein